MPSIPAGQTAAIGVSLGSANDPKRPVGDLGSQKREPRIEGIPLERTPGPAGGTRAHHRAPDLQGDPILGGSDPDAVTDVIDLPGLPTALLTSAKGKTGLAVFQAKTGEPYLTLGDTDGDGVFDMLVYFSLSADGETLATVEDYGMDGQPDFILNSILDQFITMGCGEKSTTLDRIRRMPQL